MNSTQAMHHLEQSEALYRDLMAGFSNQQLVAFAHIAGNTAGNLQSDDGGVAQAMIPVHVIMLSGQQHLLDELCRRIVRDGEDDVVHKDVGHPRSFIGFFSKSLAICAISSVAIGLLILWGVL